MRRYGLRDDQWERIKDFLPGRPGWVGVTAADNRLFVKAVLYRYRAGIPWRDLPERFGDWKNLHRRFSRWAKSGENQAIGRSRGGLSTEIHTLVDADDLLPDMQAGTLIADKAFDADQRVIE